MSMLTVKLRRNLWTMKGQVLAIALVVASGVAMFVMSLTVVDSLRLTQNSMYQRQQFADLFVDLKRANEPVATRLRELPGIQTLETRVRAPVSVRVRNFTDPVIGQVLSIPDGRQPALNRLFLREGQLPDAYRSDQVLVAEAFAEAHQLHPGDTLEVVINGRFQSLVITGIVLSPEFIYQIRPGDLFPDFARYGILWMNRSALGAAFNMEGAFNSALIRLSPGANPNSVIDAMDDILAPWGGLGAHDRSDLMSHRYISQELEQLDTMARFLPAVFMGVAAFLLNVVAARLIRTQREQIAILKAFGYTNTAVAAHYLGLVLVILALGSIAGILAGLWMASGLATIYQDFFRFPWLEFRLQPAVALTAVLIAGGATIAGTLGAILSAFRLPPAEAMRPAPPAHFRATLAERLGIRWFSPPTRIILRNLERQPVKAGLSVLGIAFAVAMMMLTGFQRGAIDFMLDVEFQLASQEDLTVTLIDPTPARALNEITALPGVRYAEGFRAVAASLRQGHHQYRTPLQGYTPDSQLTHVLNDQLRPEPIPPFGLLLTDHLAHQLDVGPGDRVEVELLEGTRQTLSLPVSGLVTEFVGVGAYVDRHYLSRLLQEGPVINGAFVAIDPESRQALFRQLENMPMVAAVTLRENSIEAFEDLMDESILVFTLVSMFMAGSIAFAVVYNNARIAFAERGRELASLRVLGFTRAEVAFILLGELLLLTLMAIPPGFALGAGFCWLMSVAMATDLYRVPLVLTTDTYAMSAAVVLAATLLSTLFIARNLLKLDMVAALKAPE